MRKQYISITILGMLVLIVCIVGFSIIGSPISQKAIRFDETRITDFSTIKSSVETFYSTNKQLPNSISDLEFTYSPEPKDPETKQSYTYEKISDTDFKLCTTFSTDSDEVSKKNQTNSRYNYSYDYLATANKHKKGYACITYPLPTYLLPYVMPTPTPQPFLLEFLKPTSKSTLCLGDDYEIEWKASSRIEEIVSVYLQTSDNDNNYFIKIPIAKNNNPNIEWVGSSSWTVGDVTTLVTNAEKIQIKPGKYKFNFYINEYGSRQYGKLQHNVFSEEFTIADCSNSSKLPISN